MFTIKKTGDNYYLASLKTNQDSLGRTECNHLKHEIQQLIKPHREITINLKGVKSINREGFRILRTEFQRRYRRPTRKSHCGSNRNDDWEGI